MNVHNELFNGVRQLKWQHLSSAVATFSTSIRLSSNCFIKHFLALSAHLSLSLSGVLHPVFLISGLSLRFGDVDVFLWNPKLVAVRHIHYPANPSSDHFHTDAVVPSSDHCRTKTVLPPRDHYFIETVAPSGDHYGIDIVVSVCISSISDPMV